ncbi:ABC-2 type transporter [Paenibacillus sp. yr247]|uniref:ABC transporter permease n=1 Tax=Paenibacillus sp. yr247 TaxID=1761880 RepID=UPI0008850133|nr:ABC transporter permease [Paenibacillus sp. yr247]SDM93527.1 ABC-2 type transporter [Paenibacillus sp. yr247]
MLPDYRLKEETSETVLKEDVMKQKVNAAFCNPRRIQRDSDEGIIIASKRTMARTYAAPVRSIEIVFGNFMGSFMVGTLQVLVILLVTRYVTNYEYGLPFLSQFIILEFFLLASMGIVSAVASLVKNTSYVGMVNTLVVTPTCMLGGCFWPISLMPDWMQKIANFVPQKWVIEAIQRMAAGQSLSQMWMHMGVLILFALILLGVGSVILKPGDAEVG